ncbi:hypothetical protein ACFSYD_25575 [Paracoccus aerius]
MLLIFTPHREKTESMKKSRLKLPGMVGASVSLWFAFAPVFDPAYAESKPLRRTSLPA